MARNATDFVDGTSSATNLGAADGFVCPGTAGYVSNDDDCDDSTGGGAIKPGVSICASAVQKKTCPTNAHGVWSQESCPYGCINGDCRPSTDGTIGVPGYVSCDLVKNCPASDGCSMFAESCSTADSPGSVHCDGPSDCSGGTCCVNAYGGVTMCSSSPCSGPYRPACDPSDHATTCNCAIALQNFPIYTCQP
jgi:hypothetical protein